MSWVLSGVRDVVTIKIRRSAMNVDVTLSSEQKTEHHRLPRHRPNNQFRDGAIEGALVDPKIIYPDLDFIVTFLF